MSGMIGPKAQSLEVQVKTHSPDLASRIWQLIFGLPVFWLEVRVWYGVFVKNVSKPIADPADVLFPFEFVVSQPMAKGAGGILIEVSH